YVLSLPDEHGRYYLMPMLSGWTDVIESPGKRTTGTGAQRYVIAGPDWAGTSSVPRAKVIRSPTNMVWLLGRTFAQETKADIAAVGLGANLPQDAIYPMTTVDATGKRLDGSNNYILHFDKGAQPPVKGFWSLTMYDPQMFFVANPLNRNQISPTQSPVTTNPD